MFLGTTVLLPTLYKHILFISFLFPSPLCLQTGSPGVAAEVLASKESFCDNKFLVTVRRNTPFNIPVSVQLTLPRR